MLENELQNSDVKLQKLHQDLAQFLALFEQSEQKYQERMGDFHQYIEKLREAIYISLESVQKRLSELDEVMSAVGAARLRAATEEMLKVGEGHAEELRKLILEFRELSAVSLSHLTKLSDETEKRMARVISKLSLEQTNILDDYRDRLKENLNEIQKVSEPVLTFMKEVQGRNRRDLIYTAVLTGLVTAFLMSLFINAEWPWESFHRSQIERQVGQSVIKQQNYSINPTNVDKGQKR